MIRLTSLLHDEVLADVLARWFVGRFEPADCVTLKRVVNFNLYLVRAYLFEFVGEMLAGTLGRPFSSVLASTKGDLKDFVCLNPPVRTSRIEAMMSHYRRFPEDYYRDTPFEGRLYYLGDRDRPEYVLSTRAKRVRRIAEKSARRIVDHVFREIKRRADELASERAAHLGIPKDRLITSEEKQIEEFAHAERRLIKAIRNGTFDQNRPQLSIDDVAGLKVITDAVPLEVLKGYLDRNGDTEIVEEETHSGRYNATNLIVRYRLPKRRLLERAPDARVAGILAARGVGPAEGIGEAYRQFVETAPETVNLEVIAASYEEMMESEIGRSMHETRIFEQRRGQEYRGHLARNTEYLVEFALTFAVSPTRMLSDLPLRVWVRYLPDTVIDLNKALWGVPASSSLPCTGEAESMNGWLSATAASASGASGELAAGQGPTGPGGRS